MLRRLFKPSEKLVSLEFNPVERRHFQREVYRVVNGAAMGGIFLCARKFEDRAWS